MTIPEILLNSRFIRIVAENHPFANFVRYEVIEEGVLIYYKGGNDEQVMLIDFDGNIIDDTTFSTKKVLELLVNVVDTALFVTEIFNEDRLLNKNQKPSFI